MTMPSASDQLYCGSGSGSVEVLWVGVLRQVHWHACQEMKQMLAAQLQRWHVCAAEVFVSPLALCLAEESILVDETH